MSTSITSTIIEVTGAKMMMSDKAMNRTGSSSQLLKKTVIERSQQNSEK